MPVYKKIASDLRGKIKEGIFNPGDRLSTENEMSNNYNVSRITLKKALTILCREGLICQIPGRGSFVCDEKEAFERREAENRKCNPNKNSKIVAILVPTISESLYPEIVRGVEDICHANECQLILGNYDTDSAKEGKYIQDFIKTGVCGMVLAPSYNSSQNEAYKILNERRVPYVLVDASIKGLESDLVATDNLEGAYQGTKYLIEKGCKRIAFVCGWLSASSSQERWFGYKKALLEVGITEDQNLFREGAYSDEFGYGAGKQILGSNADGVLCANEPIANGLFRAVAESGNSSLQIASFDTPFLPANLKNAVLLLGQQKYEIGRAAAELLFQRMSGGYLPFRKILVEPQKILKASGK